MNSTNSFDNWLAEVRSEFLNTGGRPDPTAKYREWFKRHFEQGATVREAASAAHRVQLYR